LGSAASSLLDSEIDEQEWEHAHRFVKLALDALNRAADAPPDADPAAIAENAVVEAARRHAPHLLGTRFERRSASAEAFRHRRHSGSWTRHGRRIVVHGV
jgi:hypothetical protein